MSGYRYMTLADRRNIETWLSEKVPPTVIADRLGVHLSTVYREIGRGRTTDAAYSAARAQETVEISLRRKGKRHILRPLDRGRKAVP